MLRRFVLIVAAVVGGSQLCGCIYSREMAQTRRQLQHEIPGADFDRQITLNLGPVALRFARFVTRRVHEDEAQMAADYLENVSRVKVGIYKTRRLPNLEDINPPTLDQFKRHGWELGVRVQEDDELVWVYYRDNGRIVTDIYAIVLSDEDLVVAHVRGRLNQLLEDAIADHGPFLELADS